MLNRFPYLNNIKVPVNKNEIKDFAINDISNLKSI